MHKYRNMLRLLWLPLLAVWTTAFTQVTDTGASDPYRLVRGDKVEIVVFGHPDLSGEFQIDAEGGISLPLVGDVAAAGSSLDELEATITSHLKPDYLKDPKVSAQLLDNRPIYVVGEVNSPGSYPFEAGMTVINAVAMAGGFTYRARKKRMVISRQENGEVTKIRATEDTQLLPRDVVEVPERFF